VPILFVSLGLGSVIASAIEAAPWIAVPGKYKGSVFTVVGVLLAFNYWFVVARGRWTDCKPGELCHPSHPGARLNRVLFWISAGIYAVAVVATYAAIWWVRAQA
jgi:hypothetical protein